MPGSARFRKQLVKMWNENPHCHWCGRITRIYREPNERITSDTATLDHLYSRLNPQRKEVNRTMEKRRLLACYECNQRRCQEEVAAVNQEKARKFRRHEQ